MAVRRSRLAPRPASALQQANLRAMFMLLGDGDFGFIGPPSAGACAITLENGSAILLENGSEIDLENCGTAVGS